jgi:hypothetical protein
MILSVLGGGIFLASLWLALAVRESSTGMRYTAFAYDSSVRSQKEEKAAQTVRCSGKDHREAA